ncbi:unnamed protein product [Hymenolepis diminuta]|uniref:Uncharacterized protein n=2 Tax=Hymenolepis diminuta TaxID=6216 RepID=A0A564YGI3_HYMDI|nr:unnamed protein product [Hymenolepis diminuta]VUZ46328.1 unnamed protein product [Hymenolepis diminuta]VUZ46330.1 unnamed protein product [Hymenolepis diminuta]
MPTEESNYELLEGQIDLLSNLIFMPVAPQMNIPGRIQLTSILTEKPWFIGFCENGRPFANEMAYNGGCIKSQLPGAWNMLHICAPIPTYCINPGCISSNETKSRGRKCSEYCRLVIECKHVPERIIKEEFGGS